MPLEQFAFKAVVSFEGFVQLIAAQHAGTAMLNVVAGRGPGRDLVMRRLEADGYGVFH